MHKRLMVEASHVSHYSWVVLGEASSKHRLLVLGSVEVDRSDVPRLLLQLAQVAWPRTCLTFQLSVR